MKSFAVRLAKGTGAQASRARAPHSRAGDSRQPPPYTQGPGWRGTNAQPPQPQPPPAPQGNGYNANNKRVFGNVPPPNGRPTSTRMGARFQQPDSRGPAPQQRQSVPNPNTRAVNDLTEALERLQLMMHRQEQRLDNIEGGPQVRSGRWHQRSPTHMLVTMAATAPTNHAAPELVIQPSSWDLMMIGSPTTMINGKTMEQTHQQDPT